MNILTTEDMELRAYELWIQDNVPPEETFGECTHWTKAMHQNFPELHHVAGEVIHKFAPYGTYHEYLMTDTGVVIDPIRPQFDYMFGHKWNYHWDFSIITKGES